MNSSGILLFFTDWNNSIASIDIYLTIYYHLSYVNDKILFIYS